MASYTDKIPTFNPYVEQQPVDAMLKVGVYKQKMYEDGVKKIQTNIDNVAGLDIANEVQQKYLQSKLNSLGNNLTFLAAGDFSDFSLVNSVNGMTKQITKDEDVLNAVSSTARLRAGYKKKAELAKKGLTDKNNDDYYDMYASDYVNSKDLKASFSADYVPYTNIVKKLQAALVGAGESETIAEQIFVTGPDNKPLITNGHYTYADSKTIEKLVTNKPAVIAAINNVLNEGNVKQQIGIDGWATYRNTEATSLLEPLKADYDSERSRLQQQALEITAMLNGTNISPEQKEMYIKAASENEAALLKNDNTFITLSKEAEDNPESFKQSYYTQEFKQRLMNQFVTEKDSKTYGTNEALQQQNYRDDMAFKKAQERNKVAIDRANLAINQSKNSLEWLKFTSDYELDPTTGNYNKKPEPGKGKVPGGTYDANKALFTAGTPGDKVNAQNIIETDISTLTEDKNIKSKSIFFDFVRTWKNNPKLDDKDILVMANTWAKEKGISTEAYLDRFVNNIKNNYDNNGVVPPPNLNDELNEFIETSSTLNNKLNLKITARASANKEADVDGELKKLLAGHQTMNFNIEGQKFTITPEDILQMEKSGLIQQLALGYGSAVRNRFSVDDKRLNANQNKFLSQWYRMSPEMHNQLFKEVNSFKGKQVKYYDTLSKAEKIYNDKLAKVVGVNDAVSGLLPMDTESKPETIGMVATYVNGGERNYGPGVDKQAVLDALDNATAISWNAKKPTNSREDWMGEIIVTGPKGTAPVTITNVNRTDLTTFTNAKFTNYVEQPIQDAINMNDKTKSTNPVYMVNSPDAWTTAHYKGTNINPAVTQAGWSYRADVIKSGGGYRLVNYVRPPNATGYTTIYGAAIATDEQIIDNTYKTTSPAELSAMYLNYLHNQTQK
jgi:hypothetical protein